MAEDKLDENGLTLKTANDIRDELVNGFKSIYGDDIILDSNTQDGQVIDIYTQMANGDSQKFFLVYVFRYYPVFHTYDNTKMFYRNFVEVRFQGDYFKLSY